MLACCSAVLLIVLPADAGFGFNSPWCVRPTRSEGAAACSEGLALAFAAPALPAVMMNLRGARSRGAAICMQDGGQPRKAQKKPRKRSNKKQNPFQMPEPELKPGGGPIGKAKRRMLERLEDMEEKQEAEWAGLKGRLQSERVEGVWAADDPALAEKRKRWNLDLSAPSDAVDVVEYDMDEDENAVDVMGTNDPDWKQVPLLFSLSVFSPLSSFVATSGGTVLYMLLLHLLALQSCHVICFSLPLSLRPLSASAGARCRHGRHLFLEPQDRRDSVGDSGRRQGGAEAISLPRCHQDHG